MRIWSGLAMAMCLAAITAGGIVISQGDGGGGNTANLWVDEAGGSGTCTRNASPAAYSSVTSCTIAEAISAASASDSIKVRCTSGSSCGPIAGGTVNKVVTLAEEDGYTVRIGSWNGSAQPSDSNSLTIAAAATVTGLTIDFFEISVSGATVDGVSGESWYITGGAQNWTVKNGDFSFQLNCGGGQSGTRDQAYISNGGSGGLVQGNNFHDNTFTNCSGVPDDPHLDCLQVTNTEAVTIERNRFWNCGADGLIVGDGNSTVINDVLLQNNFFGPTPNTDTQEINFTPNLAGGATCGGSIIRYNTVRTNDNVSNGDWNFQTHCIDPTDIYGNIFPLLDDFTCETGWSYNTGTAGNVSGTDCGTGSQVVTTASIQFTDAANGDYHIGASSSVLGDGSPTNCPSTDYDGQSRPQGGGNCDVGADER